LEFAFTGSRSPTPSGHSSAATARRPSYMVPLYTSSRPGSATLNHLPHSKPPESGHRCPTSPAPKNLHPRKRLLSPRGRQKPHVPENSPLPSRAGHSSSFTAPFAHFGLSGIGSPYLRRHALCTLPKSARLHENLRHQFRPVSNTYHPGSVKTPRGRQNLPRVTSGGGRIGGSPGRGRKRAGMGRFGGDPSGGPDITTRAQRMVRNRRPHRIRWDCYMTTRPCNGCGLGQRCAQSPGSARAFSGSWGSRCMSGFSTTSEAPLPYGLTGGLKDTSCRTLDFLPTTAYVRGARVV
jgi:hypothetical protein